MRFFLLVILISSKAPSLSHADHPVPPAPDSRTTAEENALRIQENAQQIKTMLSLIQGMNKKLDDIKGDTQSTMSQSGHKDGNGEGDVQAAAEADARRRLLPGQILKSVNGLPVPKVSRSGSIFEPNAPSPDDDTGASPRRPETPKPSAGDCRCTVVVVQSNDGKTAIRDSAVSQPTERSIVVRPMTFGPQSLAVRSLVRQPVDSRATLDWLRFEEEADSSRLTLIKTSGSRLVRVRGRSRFGFTVRAR